MIKKLFFSLISAVLFLSSFSLPVLAQTDSSQGQGMPAPINEPKTQPNDLMIDPGYIPPNPNQLPFSGQNQNYSVVFRGNGEAIVTLRVALTNTSEDNSALSDVSLRVPKVNPTDISVYQIIVQGPCVRYDYTPQTRPGAYIPPSCLQYGEPDYYNYYSGGKYQKATFDYSGDTLKVTLPKPIVSQKSGSFFVYYRAFGYAKKNVFGAYTFDFETLKVDQAINQLTVGISTDADQVLKNAKGTVDYRFNEASSTALKAAPAMGAGAIASPTIDSFVSRIGQGSIVKSASNLASLESYKVTGMYASSRTKLYGKEIATLIGVIFLFVILLVLVIRRLMKRTAKKESDTEDVRKSSDTDAIKNFLIALGVSFASALLSAGYTVVVFIVGSSLDRLVDYQYQAVIVILLVVISFAIYILFILGPAIYLGFKKGVGWGIGTVVMTTIWLILFGAVTVFVLFAFTGSPYYPPIMPMYDGVMTK